MGHGAQPGTPATVPNPGVRMPTWPARQHTPHPAAANVPALQGAQALGAVLPAVATKRPAGHGVQAVAPVPPPSNVPGAQVEHAVAEEATDPAAHVEQPLPVAGA